MNTTKLIYCTYFGVFYQDDKGYYYMSDRKKKRINKTKQQVINGLDYNQRKLYESGKLII